MGSAPDRRRSPCLATLALAVAVAAAALAGLAFPPAASAQQPDLNLLAIDWARGRYASPLFCEIDGEARRGLRRLLITPGPRHVRPPVGRIVFVKLEVEEATRCFTALGEPSPNIWGQLQIRVAGRSQPDTARRDFDAMLRRKDGFEFEVPEGRLQIQTVGKDAPPPRTLPLRGGRANLRFVMTGTDDSRLLDDLPGEREVELKIEAPGGEIVRLPLVLTDLR